MDASDRTELDDDQVVDDPGAGAETPGASGRRGPVLEAPAMTFGGSAEWSVQDEERSRALGYVGVALLAGTIGATLGILLAPDSGRNTRRKVARRIGRERQALERRAKRMLADCEEYVEDRLKEAAERIDELVKDGRKALEHAADQATDQVEAGRKKVARILK